jgi:hypothetical protein
MGGNAMKNADEIRAEYRREDLAKDVRGKHKTDSKGKSIVPDQADEPANVLAAFAGTLSTDFPDEITDDDLGVDAPRLEMDW